MAFFLNLLVDNRLCESDEPAVLLNVFFVELLLRMPRLYNLIVCVFLFLCDIKNTF